MDKSLIQYISWYYTTIMGPIDTGLGYTITGKINIHLVRMKNGQGLLKTDKEMVDLGLASWRTGK